MSYDLTAHSDDGGEMGFGGITWSVVVEIFGYLFPLVVREGGQWFHAPDVDPLVTDDDQHGYRLLLSNDDFEVSAEDAKLMARCVRNYVALNSLDRPVDSRPEGSVGAGHLKQMAAFAAWAERSDGFTIS